MRKSINALMFKEYREMWPIWLMMLMGGIFMATSRLVLSGGFVDSYGSTMLQNGILATFLVAVVVYMMVTAAISYSREIEENRYELLRRFPITPQTLLVAKLGAILLSSGGMGLCFGVVAILFWAIGSVGWNEDSVGDFGLFALSAAEFLVWGLFWTTRCRRQMTSLLLTPVCAFCVPLGVVLEGYTTWWGIAFRLAILAVILIPTVRGLLRWFETQTRYASRASWVPVERLEADSLAARSTVSTLPKKIASPWSMLLWQGLAQGKYFNVKIAGIMALVIVQWGLYDLVAPHFALRAYHTDISPIPFFILSILTLTPVLANGVLTFRFVQREETILTRFGVSPLQYWSSRLVGGGLLVIPLIALFFGIGWMEESLYPEFFNGRNADTIWLLCRDGGMVLTSLFTFFFAGLWAGAVFRSRMVALVFTFGLWFISILGFWGIGTVCFDSFVKVGMLSSTILFVGIVTAFLLLLLLASYFQVRAVLLERRNFSAKMIQFALIVGIPGVFLLVGMPILRVRSVPLLPGAVESWLSQRVDKRMENFWPLTRGIQHSQLVREQIRSASSLEPLIDHWFRYASVGRNGYGDWKIMVSLSCEIETEIYEWLQSQGGKLDLMSLRTGIELLEIIPETRPNLYEQGSWIAGKHYAKNRWGRNEPLDTTSGETWAVQGCGSYVPRSCWPWENVLYRRILANKLVRFHGMAHHVEDALYHETEPFSNHKMNRYARGGVEVLSQFLGFNQLRERGRYNPDEPRSADVWREEFQWALYTSNSPYCVEVQRRVLLLELATLLYYREEGDWPETLDALVAAGYLDTLPTLPGTMGRVKFDYSTRLAKPINVRFQTERRNGIDHQEQEIERLCAFAIPLGDPNVWPAESGQIPRTESRLWRGHWWVCIMREEGILLKNDYSTGQDNAGLNRVVAETPIIYFDTIKAETQEDALYGFYSVVPFPLEPNTETSLDTIRRLRRSESGESKE